MGGYFCQTLNDRQFVSLCGIRVAECRSGEKEKRARVNSAAVGGVGHGHGVETPARG